MRVVYWRFHLNCMIALTFNNFNALCIETRLPFKERKVLYTIVHQSIEHTGLSVDQRNKKLRHQIERSVTTC